jgi:KDO2-lipid IV(A) lauroyltransferase
MCYRLLSWLPLPVLYLLAWLGYLLLYYVAGYRKAVVQQNLASAFPDKSASELTVLAKKFYRQLVQVALEILKTRRMSADAILRRVRLVNSELVAEYSNNFKESVIILSIHQGNWEWMLHGVRLGLGVPIDPVYKPLHNRNMDRLILDIRSRFGSRPLPMAAASADILRRRREFRLLVMLADQSPIARERSYWTQFMNRDAAFYQGGEAIARMAGYPVLFAQCRRRSRGYYDVEFREVARPPYDRDGHLILDRYVRLAEEAIRSEPESWLWSNRRWKRQKPPLPDDAVPRARG